MTAEDLKQRIWSRCTRCESCLLWDGPTDGNSPVMRLPPSRRLLPVRRILMEAMGIKLAGRLATTSCGNKLCMDPKHVKAWTRKQLQQRTAKANSFAKSPARRAKIAMQRRKTATLTIEAVREMRLSGLNTREAAERYGVCQSTAAQAMNGATWRDYANPFAGLM